jgi:flagellar protein FliO/FliZ
MIPQSTPIAPAESWLRMSLALAFVIGLIFLCAWLLKKMSGGMLMGKHSVSGQMKILARTALGDKRELMVVDIAGRILLLGVTVQSINLITELEAFDHTAVHQDNLFERIFRSAGKRTDGDAV